MREVERPRVVPRRKARREMPDRGWVPREEMRKLDEAEGKEGVESGGGLGGGGATELAWPFAGTKSGEEGSQGVRCSGRFNGQEMEGEDDAEGWWGSSVG